MLSSRMKCRRNTSSHSAATEQTWLPMRDKREHGGAHGGDLAISAEEHLRRNHDEEMAVASSMAIATLAQVAAAIAAEKGVAAAAAAAALQEYEEDLLRAPEPLEFDIENPDYLGPVFRSLYRMGIHESFVEKLGSHITHQSHELGRSCNLDFVSFRDSTLGIPELLKQTEFLKRTLVTAVENVQASARDLLLTKRQIVGCRTSLANVEKATQEIEACIEVLEMVEKLNSLFADQRYSLALLHLDSINSFLRAMGDYQFVQELRDVVPRIQDTIRLEAEADLLKWLVLVHENTRLVGCAALRQVEVPAIGGFYDPFDNEFVRLDFTPLYQSINVFMELESLTELRRDFDEQRQLQADVIFSSFCPSKAFDIDVLEKFLQIVAGFFTIEGKILESTFELRCAASVKIIWDRFVERITDIVETAVPLCLSISTYVAIKEAIDRLVLAIPFNKYRLDLARVCEGLQLLPQHYCLNESAACIESFKSTVEPGQYKVAKAANAEELESVHKIINFHEPRSLTLRKVYPRDLPFTNIVLQCGARLRTLINTYYGFANQFCCDLPESTVDATIRTALETLLKDHVLQPIIEIMTKHDDLMAVLMVLVDLNHLQRLSIEFQEELKCKRIFKSPHGFIELQVTTDFYTAIEKVERVAFQKLHVIIDMFLSASNYNFLSIPVSSTTMLMPSTYIREMINFLTRIMYTTLENLPEKFRSYIYLEIFDYLATKMMNTILVKSQGCFTQQFVKQFDVDLGYIEKYITTTLVPMLSDTFLPLRQLVSLMLSNNPIEYLDPAICYKHYGRLKPAIVVEALRTLSNGLAPQVTQQTISRRKMYNSIMVAILKRHFLTR